LAAIKGVNSGDIQAGPAEEASEEREKEMTTKNKTKERARAIQERTGFGYRECLSIAQRGISDAGVDSIIMARSGNRLLVVDKPKEPGQT